MRLSRETVKDRRRLFNNAWRQLAAIGVCDSWGGREYCRVAKQYVIRGMPVDVVDFITKFANKKAGGA